MKQIRSLFVILIVLCLTFSTYGYINTDAATVTKLTVHFIDVGQGDGILIQQGTKNMLIDAGTNEDEKLMVNYLNKQGIKKLDVVIGTHPHEDHIGGMDAVIKNFSIGAIYMPKVTNTTKTFEDVLTAIKAKGLKVNAPTAGSTFKLGDATCTILAPNGSQYEDLNNYSLVIKVTYGTKSFLFTGDAEAISEKEMINKKYNLKADVLKVGHHGSSSSTSADFLKAVNPTFAVISMAKGNDYGHPHKETMALLKAKSIKVYRTDECGTIIATSDGKTIAFNVKQGSYNPGSATSSGTKPGTLAPATPSKPTTNEKIVYYTPSGKSYHFDKNCRTLKNSKNILSGKLSDVIKAGHSDPCNVCAGGK